MDNISSHRPNIINFQVMESSGIEAGNTASPLSPESLRSSESVAEWEGSQETVSTDHRRPSRIKKGRAPKRPTPSLACINCRTKKVKVGILNIT